jgi:xylulose-5-phosphate/fructose-6-phosphate phosphoketolase
MQVRNTTSRFHLVIQTAQQLAAKNPKVAARAEMLIRKYKSKLREHENYIVQHGIDLPEIRDWKWER